MDFLIVFLKFIVAMALGVCIKVSEYVFLVFFFIEQCILVYMIVENIYLWMKGKKIAFLLGFFLHNLLLFLAKLLPILLILLKGKWWCKVQGKITHLFYIKILLNVLLKCIGIRGFILFILEILRVFLEVLGRLYVWYYMMKLERDFLKIEFLFFFFIL